MASEPQTVEGVISRTDSNDSSQTVEVDGETYEYTTEKPWRDADLLEELYWEEGMGLEDIADSVGCGSTTVHKWMKKLDIDRRTPSYERPPQFTQDEGYEVWRHQIGDKTHQVSVHRLLAVAELGADAVAGMDVHHKNHIPWDNRAENIEVLTKVEHGLYHGNEMSEGRYEPWQSQYVMRKLYVEKQMSALEIADELGCGDTTINHWLNRHGIEKRSRSEVQKLVTDHDQPWQDEDLLREMYLHKKMSAYEIADELGCGDTTINRWLNRYGIEKRSQSEAQQLRRADENQQTLTEAE